MRSRLARSCRIQIFAPTNFPYKINGEFYIRKICVESVLMFFGMKKFKISLRDIARFTTGYRVFQYFCRIVQKLTFRESVQIDTLEGIRRWRAGTAPNEPRQRPTNSKYMFLSVYKTIVCHLIIVFYCILPFSAPSKAGRGRGRVRKSVSTDETR